MCLSLGVWRGMSIVCLFVCLTLIIGSPPSQCFSLSLINGVSEAEDRIESSPE